MGEHEEERTGSDPLESQADAIEAKKYQAKKDHDDSVEQVLAAIKKCNDPVAEYILMSHIVHVRPFEDIAHELGLSESAVYKKYDRFIAKVRKTIREGV